MTEYTEFSDRDAKICAINQTIDNDQYNFGSYLDPTIESIHFRNNKATKSMPRKIGEKSPSLRRIEGNGCGLTIIRDFYFKNLQNLESLILNNNQIKTIEPSAFVDLIKLGELHLHFNQIETLDQKLFLATPRLGLLYLANNNIKFLSPSTLNIPALEIVHLGSNVCIDAMYFGSDDVNRMKLDLKANCTHA